jgi:hypothetical protein
MLNFIPTRAVTEENLVLSHKVIIMHVRSSCLKLLQLYNNMPVEHRYLEAWRGISTVTEATNNCINFIVTITEAEQYMYCYFVTITEGSAAMGTKAKEAAATEAAVTGEDATVEYATGATATGVSVF